MSFTSTRIGPALVAGALMCTLAGCGGNPTQAGTAKNAESPETTAAGETYEKFASMPAGKERKEALVQTCQDEGGLVINSAASIVAELVPAFEKEYGVDVSLVEPTSSESQRQRILQEHKAGEVSADLLVTYSSDLSHIYTPEGVTAKYTSPITKQLEEEVQSENYIALYQYPVIPQYNTNLVSSDDAPRTYADLADPKWKGKLGLVRGDGNWYFTLFDYLTNEGGMSVEEFKEIFTGIAANARAFEGHGSASLVAAGEIPILINGFQLFTLNLQEENAPISSEPPIEPTAMLLFGAGMTTTADNPGCATLFSEWTITDGQQTIMANNYYPVNFDAIPGEVPYSVEDHELAHIQIDSINAEQFAAWQTAFDNLLSGSGDILPEYVR